MKLVKPPKEAHAIRAGDPILADIQKFLSSEYCPDSETLEEMSDLKPQEMLGQLMTMQAVYRLKHARSQSGRPRIRTN